MNSDEIAVLFWQKRDIAHTKFSGQITQEAFDMLAAEMQYLVELRRLVDLDADGLFADISLADMVAKFHASPDIALPSL